MIKRITLLFSVVLGLTFIVYGQGDTEYDQTGRSIEDRIIRTTVPFLTIAPESRGSAMGDAGVASSPDLVSQHWNSAKYVMMDGKGGVSFSYTPWLRNLSITDIDLAYVSGFLRIDEQQVVSGSLRYFRLGEITLKKDEYDQGTRVHPNEFAIDAGYSRLLSKNLSAGLVFRFIYSNFIGGRGSFNNDLITPGVSFASDISSYYEKPISIDGRDSEFAIGLNISNVGFKMSYTEGGEKQFIPTNLRIGGRLTIELDDYNSISGLLDFNKLLVPLNDSTSGPIEGIFKSFADAPDGFKEEMQEIMISAGAEYWYREQFAIRAGYFYENPYKGDRQYLTLGVGLKMNVFSFDFSYLIPTSVTNSPLQNTMRFTLGFLFE